jgi:hypothetical protein
MSASGHAELLGPFVLIGRRPRATGELDFLLPHVGFAEIARQLALRASQIDLEGQRVQPRPAVENPPHRRIGNEPAIPRLCFWQFWCR